MKAIAEDDNDRTILASAAVANANTNARSQLAPILTQPANDELVNALLSARNRAQRIGGRSLYGDYLATQGTLSAGREAGRRYNKPVQ